MRKSYSDDEITQLITRDKLKKNGIKISKVEINTVDATDKAELHLKKAEQLKELRTKKTIASNKDSAATVNIEKLRIWLDNNWIFEDYLKLEKFSKYFCQHKYKVTMNSMIDENTIELLITENNNRTSTLFLVR